MVEKIVIIGSGNWGSAIAQIVGRNVAAQPLIFDSTVPMWVFDEQVGTPPQSLVHIINTTHENVKYLPNHVLPTNIVAVASLAEAVQGATLLIFVLPHQFLPRLFPQIIQGLAASKTPLSGVRAISLIKGVDLDENGLVLISDTIRKGLGGNVDVSVLMGANVADEVARGDFCEATIGFCGAEHGPVWKRVFDAPLFRVSLSPDYKVVELCGALKNVVAVGAGFCDGLGFGTNTKSAIMRIGLLEMIGFIRKFYAADARLDTFFESCGIADLITTCFGGRNRKCAEAFAKQGGKRSWEDIEGELLQGQKLQGTLTAFEVAKILDKFDGHKEFPLFSTIARIATGKAPVTDIVNFSSPPLHLAPGAN